MLAEQRLTNAQYQNDRNDWHTVQKLLLDIRDDYAKPTALATNPFDAVVAEAESTAAIFKRGPGRPRKDA
jgi:hypothetical protein